MNDSSNNKSTFKWTRMLIKKLITTYEQFELLYNSKHKDYTSGLKKQEALEIIRDKLNQTAFAENGEGLTVFDIKSKFRLLRSQFRMEMRAITNSKQFSGGAFVEIYEPRLWCYNLLLFLKPYLFVKELPIKKGATKAQKSRLVELVADYYAMLFIPAVAISKEEKNQKWEEIASELNIMGPPQSSEHWIATFRNMRYRTRLKMTKLRKYQQGIDFYGLPLSIKFTHQDKLICKMIGERDISQLGRPPRKQQETGYMENDSTTCNPVDESALNIWTEVAANGTSAFPIDTEPQYQNVKSEYTTPKPLRNENDRNTCRLIKIKEAKLKFEVAQFKFLHPDFHFDDAIMEFSDSE